MAGPRLAAAVSRAGGLGTLGLRSPRRLAADIREAMELSGGRSVAVNLLLPYIQATVTPFHRCLERRATMVPAHRMRTNSRTPAVWTGEIDLAPKWALFVGAGGRTRRHSHPVHKLVVQIAPPVSVVNAHLLAPGVWFVRGRDEHVVIARGRVALLFLDVGALSDAEIANLRSSVVAAAEGLRAEDRMVRAEAASALAAAAPRVLDARVAEAAAILRSEAGTGVGELARRVGLSATRLTHLFTAQVGVAPRRYRGWGALRRALAEMARGRSLTEVAHAAGFSDAAHFSRSFAKFLGVVPSSLSPIVVRGG